MTKDIKLQFQQVLQTSSKLSVTNKPMFKTSQENW